MNWEKIKTGLWGAIGGAIVLAIVGFAWGGWVTGGTARQMAEDVVVGRLAPICVEQYNQDSEKDQKLKELKEKASWERSDYVQNKGWATMPGEKNPDRKVAEKCADLVIQLSQ